MLLQHRIAVLRRCASMGPRPGGCGDDPRAAAKTLGHSGFNGAAPRRVRRSRGTETDAGCLQLVLQWGRAPEGAEIVYRNLQGLRWRRFNGAAPRRVRRYPEQLPCPVVDSVLQWGRAPEGAEMEKMLMETKEETGALQWGRAPEGAEISLSTVQRFPLILSLQWGRAPEGAEIQSRGDS